MIFPEAPTPLIETNKPIDDNNTKYSHEYKLNLNEEKSFKLFLLLNEEKKYIIIKAIPNEEFSQKEYEVFLSLDELIIKNKQFKMFDYINEAFSLIIKIFDKDRVIIKEFKKDELIKLEIKLLSLTGEEQIFDINLYQKDLNKDQIINQLISRVISLEKEIKEIKKENYKRDKEIQSLKNIINDFINKKKVNNNNKSNIISNDKIIISLSQIRNCPTPVIEENNNNIDSKIVNDNSLNFVIDELKKIYKISNNNKVFNSKLLYRGTRDGFSSKSFHTNCDNIKGTLILVKNDKKIKFGGFTKETWNGDYIAKKDEDDFLFFNFFKKNI